LKPSPLDFLKLTKPTINLLVLITGAAALVVEGSLTGDPARFLLVLVALFCTAGCANALNQYFERDIDAQMARTAKKRPLPSGRITPGAALAFAVLTGVAGVAIFALAFNVASAVLALATILFYSFFYTLWLKPRTYLNIVIGGAAGAMGPILAWVAATGTTSWAAWIMFAIIFFWTPPHFWALAYCLKDEYKTVNYPMLPVARGDQETLRQIYVYTIWMLGITMLLLLTGAGLVYLLLATTLGGLFLKKAAKFKLSGERRLGWGLFAYSIVYLLVLFVGIMVDATWLVQPWKG
jgi:protoheme IX farnesyltransferase